MRGDPIIQTSDDRAKVILAQIATVGDKILSIDMTNKDGFDRADFEGVVREVGFIGEDRLL